jgi:hypothetical protein
VSIRNGGVPTNRSVALIAPEIVGLRFVNWTSPSEAPRNTPTICFEGPSRDQVWTASYAPAALLATSITGASVGWTRTYSPASSDINPGSLTYQVIVGGLNGTGWNVQLSASDFQRAEGGDGIPASNLMLTGSTNPGVTGITRPATSGSLAGPVKVLSATATVPPGTYTQTLNLNMNIPGGTLVGTYTSTITVSAAAGP